MMRILLIVVVILNVMKALGIALKILANDEFGGFTQIGMAFDAAVLPLSIAIIAMAVLTIYPYNKRKPPLE